MKTNISKNFDLMTYKVGDLVEESGTYVCVPCGYRKHLTEGERFPNCFRCLGRSNVFRKGLELWEKIKTA